ncbi:MTBP_C domain-containing protein [Trichonephila clavata]|uniref:MTBP_C domain-containing protein n=1 Tax=Trichonephila clavata TaxID=2740835 RepID=A0A8X6HR96_TRICU|nr:MTBP_C domain-containing protein [Trichonephila clavata]
MDSWPKQPKRDDQTSLVTKERKRTAFSFPVSVNCDFIDSLFLKFSSFSKIIDIFAFCFRYITNCKARVGKMKSNLDFKGKCHVPPLTTYERRQASNTIFSYIQNLFFKEEINCLKADKPVASKSILSALCPFIYKDGLIRVGGRLRNSTLQYSAKHPIILPNQHEICNLIVNIYHILYLHAGCNVLLGIIKQTYWIIGIKKIVKKCIHKCIICCRYRATTSKQLMGDLPALRVTPSRPFSACGVDYAGPINVLRYRVFISIEDITKSFESSGEAKDSTQSQSISQNNKLNHINTTYKKVLQSRWPDLIKCAYHDMYYNIDKQAVEKEAVGNNMIRIYVQNESATTCNNQQLNPNSSILVKTKVQAQKQKWRSPSKLKLSPQKSLNLVYKTYMSSMLQSSKSKNVNQIDLPVKKTSNKIRKSGKRHLKKKTSMPVRCSPRKKKNLVYSKPGSSRQPSQVSNQKQSNSTQIPEILKKKLRVAIASALEKNGINMDHISFRPCFRKLFTVCQAFVKDIPCKKGSTSERMQKIADAHVKQVIEFEKQKGGI